MNDLHLPETRLRLIHVTENEPFNSVSMRHCLENVVTMPVGLLPKIQRELDRMRNG